MEGNNKQLIDSSKEAAKLKKGKSFSSAKAHTNGHNKEKNGDSLSLK